MPNNVLVPCNAPLMNRSEMGTDMEQHTGRTGLLIVHLSSIDSYTECYGLAAGEELVCVLDDAIRKWDGPVFLTDQGWEAVGRVSQPRMCLEKALAEANDLTRFPFDEDTTAWDDAMPHLADVLRSRGVTRLVLAGVWATLDGASGCVNETCRQLSRRGLACRIDYTLCGVDEDGEGERV